MMRPVAAAYAVKRCGSAGRTMRDCGGYPGHETSCIIRLNQGFCCFCSRRVTRTEYDGTITVIGDRFNGKRLNSPNDVVVKSDGSIWFSDPDFGIISNYEGQFGPSEIHTDVYRVDGQTGKLSIVIDDIPRPNGIAFSPDGATAFVTCAGSAEIVAFDGATGRERRRRRIETALAPTASTASPNYDAAQCCQFRRRMRSLIAARSSAQ